MALVEEIVKSLRTGVPPVPPNEALEILAFMRAAQVSREAGKCLCPNSLVEG